MLRQHGDLYERGGELVRVVSGGFEPVSDDWLLDYFDRHVTFSVARKTKEGIVDEVRDAPQWLGKRVNTKKGERGIPELRGVITAPTMRDDGTLLDQPGYAEMTGLLLVKGKWPRVPDAATEPELRAAAATLWKPFSEFPFVDVAARGVMLAAIFTAVLRQTIRLAPGFTFDAPARRCWHPACWLCAEWTRRRFPSAATRRRCGNASCLRSARGGRASWLPSVARSQLSP